MVDGTLSLRKRELPESEDGALDSARNRMIRSGSYRYFVRGRNHTPAQDDAVVEHTRKERLQPYDKFLKKFQYHNALDAALTVSVRFLLGL